MKKWEQCVPKICQSLDQVVKQTKGFWCFLAMDRTNFSSPASFLGWDEAGTGWKNNHKSCFGLWFCSEPRKCLLPPWPPEAYFKSEDQFSIAALYHRWTIYTFNYDVFFPGPQSALIKEENGTMPILQSEKHHFLFVDRTLRPDQCKLLRITVARYKKRSILWPKRSPGMQTGLQPWFWCMCCFFSGKCVLLTGWTAHQRGVRRSVIDHTHNLSHVWVYCSLRTQWQNNTWLQWVPLKFSSSIICLFLSNPRTTEPSLPICCVLCSWECWPSPYQLKQL